MLSLSALVAFPSWKYKQGYQVSIPVNKKENLSVAAFSGSLKSYNYEHVSNLKLIAKI